ncbi:hypothetical protein C8R46DRAFT_1223640 [Mycena filopes]|nr:hypothetical protein C8R46DRAFT_1223640 [Mycena filopes]
MSFRKTSSLADKLGTNYVPSGPEIQAIRALLVGPQADLAQLDAQIAQAQALLHRLSARRVELIEDIDAHKALLSPMRRLPQDVLGEIFISCLPSTHNAVVDPRSAPLLLGLVCRRWRGIAHSTPRLWSSLHIPCIRVGHDPIEALTRYAVPLEGMIKAWLGRAGALPLSISFANTSHSSSICDLPLLNQLFKVSRRIRHLDLRVHSPSVIFKELLRFELGEISALESLTVIGDLESDKENEPEMWKTMTMLQCPSLCRVSLSAIAADALALPLPWSRLTHLFLYCCYAFDGVGLNQKGALTLLRRCPNLVQCQLAITRRTRFIPSSTVTLSYMRSFTVTLRSGTFIEPADFMECLILPRLCHLRIEHLSFRSAPLDFIPTDGGLVAEISPTLFPRDQLVRLLHGLPGIRRLHLTSQQMFLERSLPQVDDKFLWELRNYPLICPLLTHITIHSSLPSYSFSYRSIIDFVAARMAGGRPLLVLDISFFDRMSMQVDDVLAGLQKFIEGGLRVKIDYPNPPPGPQYHAREGLKDTRD